MTNDYHLFVETLRANLSEGMRQLNGVFTQSSNRRHGRTGHLFQGRYKAILVDAESYFQELSRYLVLNPVRAGIVRKAGAWPWSSYRSTAGQVAAPNWLTTDTLLSTFARDRGRVDARVQRHIRLRVGLPRFRRPVFLSQLTAASPRP